MLSRGGVTDTHSDCVRGFPSHFGNLAEKQTPAKKNLLETNFLKELRDVQLGRTDPAPAPAQTPPSLPPPPQLFC